MRTHHLGLASLLALALALALVVPSSHGFLASPALKQLRSSSSGGANACSRCRAAARASGGMQMLVEPKGSDAFKELESEAEGSPLAKLDPKTSRILTTGVVPVAATIGWLAAGFGGTIGRSVGAVATGALGAAARKRLAEEGKLGAPAAVARLLQSKGFDKTDPSDVLEVGQEYGLGEEEVEELGIDIYARYLTAACAQGEIKASELKELKALSMALGLGGEALGDAHYEACSKLYKTKMLFTPSEELADEWNPNRRSIDKFLFVSERMFSSRDTEEACVYEMGRLRKMLDLEPSDVEVRCAAVARPLYEKALGAAVTKLGSVKPEALARAASTVGLPDALRDEIHLAAFRNEVKLQLQLQKAPEGEGKSAATLAEGAKDRLEALGELLTIPKQKQAYELQEITLPLYAAAVERAFNSVVGKPLKEMQSAIVMEQGKLAKVQLDLAIAAEASSQEVVRIVKKKSAELMKRSAQLTRIGTAEQAAAAAGAVVEFVLASAGVVEDMVGLGRGDGVSFLFPGPLLTQAEAREARPMYQMFVDSFPATEDRERLSRMKTKTSTLARLVGISAAELAVKEVESTGPKLLEALNAAIDGSEAVGAFSSEAKSAMEALIADCDIPAGQVEEASRAAYLSRLQRFSQGGAIMTAAEAQHLAKIRDFFGIPEEEVQKMHRVECARAYEQSVFESMGATGVIEEELKRALKILQQRLSLSDESATELYYNAVRQRLKPIVDGVMYEFRKSTGTITEKEEAKDEGEDILIGGSDVGQLGIGVSSSSTAVTADIINAVDILEDNDLLRVKEDGSIEADITLKGMIPEQDLEKFYQNFLVTAFSASPAVARRYDAASSKLAAALGLEPKAIETIQSNMGVNVVGKFLSQTLGSNGNIGPAELTFLASVQRKLGMGDGEFEHLVQEAKKSVLRRMAEGLFSAPSIPPGRALMLREACTNVGLDMKKDLKLSKEQRQKLFVIEVAASMKDKNSNVTKDDLSEVAEALSLEEEEASHALEGFMTVGSKESLFNASADAIRGRDTRALEAIDVLLAYLRLTGGFVVDAPEVEREGREAILSIFQAARLYRPGISPEERKSAEADFNLLREALEVDEIQEEEEMPFKIAKDEENDDAMEVDEMAITGTPAPELSAAEQEEAASLLE
jgi:hypothetical protein